MTPPLPDLLSAGRHCQEKGRRDGLAEGHRSISARASERREVATSAIYYRYPSVRIGPSVRTNRRSSFSSAPIMILFGTFIL